MLSINQRYKVILLLLCFLGNSPISFYYLAKDTASGMPNGSGIMSAGRHFNVRLNRKLDAGDAGFLPLHLRICDSPSSGANCREKRLQVLVDVPEARRRSASVNTGALTAVVLIIVLGISELI